jgi:hypothetical protein
MPRFGRESKCVEHLRYVTVPRPGRERVKSTAVAQQVRDKFDEPDFRCLFFDDLYSNQTVDAFSCGSLVPARMPSDSPWQ